MQSWLAQFGFWAAAVVIALGRPLQAEPPGSDWRLVFADEFSGTAIDRVKWATQYEWGRTHNHDAYMLDSNVLVGDGRLALRATREPSPAGRPYSSAVISSHGTFRHDSGYVEARIKMPSNRGSWPAFWMLRQDWPPEIDIMEYPLFVSESGSTNRDRYAVNNFWGTCCDPPSDFAWISRGVDLSADYHTYALQWDSTGLRFYFDGQQVRFSSYKPDFFNMYLILNYAVGGWPGAPSLSQWPQGTSDETHVDWVRVWRTAPDSNVSTWTLSPASVGQWDTAGNWSGGVPNYERQEVVLPTLGGRTPMEIRWSNSRTVGSIILNGNTVYTLGQAGGAVESIMFADTTDGWGEILVPSGIGGHVFNARLDLWSNLAATNDTDNPITFNGDIVGQGRINVRQIHGGLLQLAGEGGFILNGDGYYQRDTLLTGGTTVELNGQLYADGNYFPTTAVKVEDESTLAVSSLDVALGGLAGDAHRIVFDNATLRLTSSGNLTRGFTVGPGGATIEVDAGATVHLTGDGIIASAAGGDLTIAGDGEGRLDRPISGDGRIVKRGEGAWVLAADNSYAGQTVIQQGRLTIDGTTGNGDTLVHVGGELSGSGTVLGNLVAQGGVIPGNSGGSLTIGGDFSLEGGVVYVEIGGAPPETFDLIEVGGAAFLAGTLDIALLDQFSPQAGDTFEILTAASLSGTLELSGDTEGFSLLFDGTTLSLRFDDILPADFNHDGIVDAADYAVWRDGLGTDFSHADYDWWASNFGAAVGAAPSLDAASHVAVPEPSPLPLLLGAAVLPALRRGCRSA